MPAVANAVRWMESWDAATGFDPLIMTHTGSGGGGVSITSSAARTGARGLRITSATHRRVEVALPAFSGGIQTIRKGLGFRYVSGTRDVGIMQLRHGATYHLSLRYVFATNSFSLRLGGVNGSELQASAVSLLAPGGFGHLEYEAHIDDSPNGRFLLYLNGNSTPIINFTGDTRNGGTAGITIFQYGEEAFPGGLGSAVFDVDDCWVQDGTHADAARIGDSFVRPRFPSAPGSDADFTPTAGANWENVDEDNPDGDTTRNQSNTVGHRDLFTMAALDIPGRIICRQWECVAKKNDAGARTFKGITTLSGEEDETAELTLSTDYQRFRALMPTAPGAVDWESVTTLPQTGYEVAS